MSRILIAWELGANFGHLGRQLPIAERLRNAGHHVLFAVRDSATAAVALTPRGFPYVQAPFWNKRVQLARPPMNYSELLLAEGFADTGALKGRVRAWRTLFEIFGAQALVVDHAPTALLAARSARVPAINVGNGFEVPPRSQPLPSIRPWQSISDDQLLRSDALVCSRTNACLAEFEGAPALKSIGDLFDGAAQVLATFAELDPYGERSEATYSGSLFSSVARTRAQWQHNSPHILAYLRNGTPGLKSALRSLRDSGSEVICVIPGVSSRLSNSLSTERFRVLGRSIHFAPLMADADVVIHSGSGTAAEALLSGVPVLSIPSNIEQHLHAQRIATFGAGIAMGRERHQADFAAAIGHLLSKGRYRERAQEFARRYSSFNPAQCAEHAAAVVERSLAEHSVRH